MSGRMPDRLSHRMSHRMSEYCIRLIVYQIQCYNVCQADCQIACKNVCKIGCPLVGITFESNFYLVKSHSQPGSLFRGASGGVAHQQRIAEVVVSEDHGQGRDFYGHPACPNENLDGLRGSSSPSTVPSINHATYEQSSRLVDNNASQWED